MTTNQMLVNRYTKRVETLSQMLTLINSKSPRYSIVAKNLNHTESLLNEALK